MVTADNMGGLGAGNANDTDRCGRTLVVGALLGGGLGVVGAFVVGTIVVGTIVVGAILGGSLGTVAVRTIVTLGDGLADTSSANYSGLTDLQGAGNSGVVGSGLGDNGSSAVVVTGWLSDRSGAGCDVGTWSRSADSVGAGGGVSWEIVNQGFSRSGGLDGGASERSSVHLGDITVGGVSGSLSELALRESSEHLGLQLGGDKGHSGLSENGSGGVRVSDNCGWNSLSGHNGLGDGLVPSGSLGGGTNCLGLSSLGGGGGLLGGGDGLNLLLGAHSPK